MNDQNLNKDDLVFGQSRNHSMEAVLAERAIIRADLAKFRAKARSGALAAW